MSAHEVWVWLNRAWNALNHCGPRLGALPRLSALAESAYLTFWPLLDFRAQARAELHQLPPKRPSTPDEGAAMIAEYIGEYWRLARLDNPSPARQRECLAKIAAYAYKTYERDQLLYPYDPVPPRPAPEIIHISEPELARLTAIEEAAHAFISTLEKESVDPALGNEIRAAVWAMESALSLPPEPGISLDVLANIPYSARIYTAREVAGEILNPLSELSGLKRAVCAANGQRTSP
ncbi:hypothetical protein [Methylomagnum ishizawai]|uniref:hypothetical protein n=1 Tax=Methylomagnum ishizawai TaxID=1760988 RepID=UPI001C7EC542|nr:hypothetical protein [Methylomagnum ishizawai]